MTPQQPGLLQTFGQTIAVVAGAAAFVYLVGGFLMWVRLRAEGLPGGAAVSPLPRELLITIALRDVVGPAILLGAFAGVLAWMLGRRDAWSTEGRSAWQMRRYPARAVLALLVPALLLAGGAYAPWESRNFPPLIAWLLALALVVVGARLITTAGSHRTQTNERAVTVPPVAAFALFVGIVALGARIFIDAWNPELEFAKVCVNDGGEDREGHLIGQTSSAVYLGAKGERQIVVIPASRVREVLIGAGEALPTCGATATARSTG